MSRVYMVLVRIVIQYRRMWRTDRVALRRNQSPWPDAFDSIYDILRFPQTMILGHSASIKVVSTILQLQCG